MGHGDLCEQCGGDKYTCGHYNVHGGCYNPLSPEEAKGSGTGGDNEEAEAVNLELDEIGDCEAIDAATKALDTITAFEREEDMKMHSEATQRRVRRIKRNSIIVLDKAVAGLREYYDSYQPGEDE